MFIFDQLVWGVMNPANLLTLVLVAGVGLYLLSGGRRGRILVGVSAFCFALLTVAPIGSAMMWPLEQRFQQPSRLPERIDGLIVLGGEVSPVVSLSSGVNVFSCSIVRVVDGVELARLHPEAKLVLVGGGSFPIGYSDVRETMRFLINEGIMPARVVLENKSRTTRENAIYAEELLRPSPGQTWVLITSAYHMPRAFGAFTGAGWQIIPYPVNFSINKKSMRFRFDLLDQLNDSTLAVHEWIGLVEYRLMGWSRELFPDAKIMASGSV